jgi:hypothetical protein
MCGPFKDEMHLAASILASGQFDPLDASVLDSVHIDFVEHGDVRIQFCKGDHTLVPSSRVPLNQSAERRRPFAFLLGTIGGIITIFVDLKRVASGETSFIDALVLLCGRRRWDLEVYTIESVRLGAGFVGGGILIGSGVFPRASECGGIGKDKQE